MLSNAFTDSQLNYAPLIWIFCRETFYSKIEKIHHRTLKVIHGIDDSCNNLLLRSNSVSIHQMHLRFLVTEISQINPECKKVTYSKLTKNSVHLLRLKCCSL